MYFDMVYRICYLYMNGCGADSEDACQQVFLKYMEHGGGFDSGEHEKARFFISNTKITSDARTPSCLTASVQIPQK